MKLLLSSISSLFNQGLRRMEEGLHWVVCRHQRAKLIQASPAHMYIYRHNQKITCVVFASSIALIDRESCHLLYIICCPFNSLSLSSLAQLRAWSLELARVILVWYACRRTGMGPLHFQCQEEAPGA